jgi:hypothetical protein
MAAIVTGTKSRRWSLAGIRLALHRFQGTSLPEQVSKLLTAISSVRAAIRCGKRPAIRPGTSTRLDMRNGIDWLGPAEAEHTKPKVGIFLYGSDIRSPGPCADTCLCKFHWNGCGHQPFVPRST